MKIYQYIVALIVIVLAACSKDKGNYDYENINELNIQGIKTEYAVRTGIDTLRIKPTIAATLDQGDTSRYNYLWILKIANKVFDTISRKRDVIYPVRLNPITYDLFYRIMDKQTGVVSIFNTKLNVSTPFSKGILIMGEDEQGFAEAEMLTMLSDTIHIKHILANSGLPRLRDPVSFVHSGSGDNNYIKLWAFTKSGSYYLDRATLAGNPMNNFLSTLYISENIEPEGLQPVVMAPQVRTAAGLTGSTLYKAMITKAGDLFAGLPLILGGDFFNNPVNRLATDQAVRIPAAPYLLYPINSMSSVMWYDTKDNRFLNYTGMGSAVASTILPDKVGDAFPWNQPAGRTLVYAENTRSTTAGTNGTSFAIMKDADDTHHIYRFYANGTNPIKSGLFTIKPIATDIEKAKFFAFSSNRSVLFYAVRSTLYAYDYNPGLEKIYTFPEIGNDEISMVKFDTQIDFAINSLYIATYNPSTKGTLRRYRVGTNPNFVDLQLQNKSTWSGLVKVKDINWRAVN